MAQAETARDVSATNGVKAIGQKAKAKLLEIAQKGPTPAQVAEQVQLSFLGRAVERLWQKLGGRYITEVASREDALRSALRGIPDRMQKLTNQANLALELIDDFRAGHYRDVRWRNLAIGAAALLYSVSPTDVIPDFIPGLGALDDAALLAIAMRLVQKDLERYCEFKGYDRAQYF